MRSVLINAHFIFVDKLNAHFIFVDDQVIMMTFQAGLNSPNFIFLLGKTSPTSIMDLLFKAQKHMNGEDALTAKGLVGKQKRRKTATIARIIL